MESINRVIDALEKRVEDLDYQIKVTGGSLINAKNDVIEIEKRLNDYKAFQEQSKNAIEILKKSQNN